MLNHTHKSEVEHWIKQLTEKDMPVFSGTVTDVTDSVNSDSSSASDVAHTILKDASLTGRLLKMANSLYFNPGRYTITTVTRAVMVLGFDQIRVLALSLILIDTLENDVNRKKMAEEMAEAFHAAVQAEGLARLTEMETPENIFVATLLSRLGNLAFWAFSGKKGQELQLLLDEGQLTASQAESKVLGFSLTELTKGLSKAWSLGELLEDSFKDSLNDEPEVKLIHLGKRLAEASKEGWDSQQAEQVIGEVSQKLDMKVDDIESYVHSIAKQAKAITKDYGIIEASKHIPQASIPIEVKGDEDSLSLQSNESQREQAELEVVMQEDIDERDEKLILQHDLLAEISDAIHEKPSINVIIEMVLEGILRGIDMDRSIFAIISKDHKTLICKYALGKDASELAKLFKIDVSTKTNVFNKVITTHRGSLIPSNPKEINGTINKNTLDSLGLPPYLIMPAVVKDKVIGVFIADRHVSKQQVDKKDFLVFQQFCEKASVGLTFLTKQH